jgi:hypothetical protein
MIGRSTTKLIPAAVLAAVGCLAAGCGPVAPPAAATVRGSVSFQGRPLAGGMIVFVPDREKGAAGRPATATIGPDGAFALTADGTAAIAPGWYRVALADPPGVFTEDAGFPRFPAALRRPDRSGLAREVVAGRENVFVFEVEVTDAVQ